MEILINDKPADITLNTEKTLGDVLQGLDLWISRTGNRIQGINADGQDLKDDTLTEAFSRNIKDIRKLNISVSTWRELASGALEELLQTSELYMNARFDERAGVKSDWEDSAAARFLATDIKDIYVLAGLTFSGEGLSPSDLILVINERLREITNPREEIRSAETLVKNIAARIEEYPLDIQTGKDQHAAETLQLFAGTGEKLFRIFFTLGSECLSLDTLIIDNLPARSFIDEFNTVLRELSAAFENLDIVLAGDIAEYELAPRLLKFYTTLKDITESDFPVMSKS